MSAAYGFRAVWRTPTDRVHGEKQQKPQPKNETTTVGGLDRNRSDGRLFVVRDGGGMRTDPAGLHRDPLSQPGGVCGAFEVGDRSTDTVGAIVAGGGTWCAWSIRHLFQLPRIFKYVLVLVLAMIKKKTVKIQK